MSDSKYPNSPSVDDNKRAAAKPRSLQRILLVVVLFSVAIPALFSGGVLIYENFKRTIANDSRVKANNYIELLEAGMIMPLWNIAPGLGQPTLDTLSVDPSVLSMRVITADETIFLSYLKGDAFLGKDDIKLVRYIAYEGEPLGSVELVYGLREARKAALDESQLLLTILLVQLVFSLFLMWHFLRKRVIKPLHLLGNASVRIAEGDLETTIPAMDNDEFGVLSSQFEKMRGVLNESFHELERRVSERTADLENLNIELKGALAKLQHAQSELVQSEKLAALGALVAGVAHELNTPIGNGMTVVSSMQQSNKKIKEEMVSGLKRASLDNYLEDMSEGLYLVSSSLEKASELVSSFKQVAVDRTSAQRRVFSLKSLLHEIKTTLATVLKHTPYVIEIDDFDDVKIDSYPGPLGQVLANLINNAVLHAYEEDENGKISIAVIVHSDSVKLVVADTGKGIEEKNQSRIFDPFFTTKLGEGGNGLGLHIVHNIVTVVLGGSIDMTSTVGVGTRFTVDIPLFAPQDLDADSLSRT